MVTSHLAVVGTEASPALVFWLWLASCVPLRSCFVCHVAFAYHQLWYLPICLRLLSRLVSFFSVFPSMAEQTRFNHNRSLGTSWMLLDSLFLSSRLVSSFSSLSCLVVVKQPFRFVRTSCWSDKVAYQCFFSHVLLAMTLFTILPFLEQPCCCALFS